jgi:hypothetical protein
MCNDKDEANHFLINVCYLTGVAVTGELSLNFSLCLQFFKASTNISNLCDAKGWMNPFSNESRAGENPAE